MFGRKKNRDFESKFRELENKIEFLRNDLIDTKSFSTALKNVLCKLGYMISNCDSYYWYKSPVLEDFDIVDTTPGYVILKKRVKAKK